MKSVNRYEEYKDVNLSKVLIDIQRAKIRTGKYSHLVKVKKDELNKIKNNIV